MGYPIRPQPCIRMTERRCFNCANRATFHTTPEGGTAFMCSVSGRTTDLTRMAWTGRFGLPVSDPANCGPEAKNWVAA